MKIKGIEFNVNAASGAMGWFGEGYWYHRILEICIPFFKKTMAGLNFVSKTTTWKNNRGNLLLDENYEPKELFPDCIKVYPLQGAMLNAVSLSGPGFRALLATEKFSEVQRDAYGISFMPIGNTLEDMLQETRLFRDKLIENIVRGRFQSTIWVQLNQSCPNLKNHNQSLDATKEILRMLQLLKTSYNIVIDLKVNLLASNQEIQELYQNKLFDILTVSNTIKFGTVVPEINWGRIVWWRKTSPLAKYGGGGLSGQPLFAAVCNKVLSLRHDGARFPIKGSGGISSVQRVRVIKACGADAIEFATAITLRPWRVYRLVKEARRIF